MRWISVSGDRLVDQGGATVVLTGFGLGGWLNMENFITGYPATETLQREALRRALGPEGYQAFFDEFDQVFFSDHDARYIASLGCNSVRLPFNYRRLEDDRAPFVIKPEGLAALDRAVEICKRAGLHVILDLHAAPGCQNQSWHSDNPTHWDAFWDHVHFQDRVVHLWRVLADRYQDEPAVAGYNLLNEPADRTGARLSPFYDRLSAAVRQIDPRHVLFLDGNTYSTDFSMFDRPIDNAVYTAHDYARPGMLPRSAYPGETEGKYFDRDKLEQVFLERTQFQRRTGTPIWVGEFGPQYTGDPARDAERVQMLRDQLDIYAAAGASWSLWTYKDVGLQGIRVVPPESSYLRQIAGVLVAKARLGTDQWGGDDSGVRCLIDPIMEVFAREFPDFDPYPWGVDRWVGVLVRSILLAEPLVSQFEAAFRGLSPAEAKDRAACFAFDKTVETTALAQVLRVALGVPETS
ncbi:MAG: glycoside hydrolase family 5 protein [Propionibacteriaceae bacterium]|jgi:aryl-phospho-beta-D-glucosidase BglC (GH1 family)|nr:glycoside hydrolase family 5 protein [Propionibacteriaceae bacterium]